MKKLVAIVLLIAIALQALRHVGIMASFMINRDYIAKNLCEKRDEPESCCKGSCYLDKQLKKATEQEEKAPAPVQKQELVWFFEENLPLTWAFHKVSDTQPICWTVKALRHQWRSGAPWQPPGA